MGNKAVSYAGAGKVEVIDTPYPEFILRDGPGVHPDNIGRQVNHGVIIKTVATNICGSDQHMVRGRTTAPEGLVLEALPEDPAGYGARLYAALHAMGEHGVGALLVEAPPATEAWGAVRDRLKRATASE